MKDVFNSIKKRLEGMPTPKTDWFIYKYILQSKHFVFNADYNEELELIKMKDEIANEVIYER